jgi:hypothetical protein
MLTEKDYCDYETCVALRELGYDGKRSNYCYIEKNKQQLESEASIFLKVFRGEKYTYVNAIHLYEAQKWLREEKDIHIEVYACAGGYIYELCKAYKPNSFSGGTTIYTPNDVDNPKLNDAGRFDDFETCLSEGIKESVKILKKNETIHE